MILLQSLYPDKRVQITMTTEATKDKLTDMMAPFQKTGVASIFWMAGIDTEEDETRR